MTGHASTLKNRMKIAIATEPFDSPDARLLVAALDGHLASRYKPEQISRRRWSRPASGLQLCVRALLRSALRSDR